VHMDVPITPVPIQPIDVCDIKNPPVSWYCAQQDTICYGYIPHIISGLIPEQSGCLHESLTYVLNLYR
jgi:hypothetical protein